MHIYEASFGNTKKSLIPLNPLTQCRCSSWKWANITSRGAGWWLSYGLLSFPHPILIIWASQMMQDIHSQTLISSIGCAHMVSCCFIQFIRWSDRGCYPSWHLLVGNVNKQLCIMRWSPSLQLLPHNEMLNVCAILPTERPGSTRLRVTQRTQMGRTQSTVSSTKQDAHKMVVLIGRSAREAIRGERWRVARALQSQKVDGDAMWRWKHA